MLISRPFGLALSVCVSGHLSLSHCSTVRSETRSCGTVLTASTRCSLICCTRISTSLRDQRITDLLVDALKDAFSWERLVSFTYFLLNLRRWDLDFTVSFCTRSGGTSKISVMICGTENVHDLLVDVFMDTSSWEWEWLGLFVNFLLRLKRKHIQCLLHCPCGNHLNHFRRANKRRPSR